MKKIKNIKINKNKNEKYKRRNNAKIFYYINGLCNNSAYEIVKFVTQCEVIFFYDRGRIERRFSDDCAIIAVAHATTCSYLLE